MITLDDLITSSGSYPDRAKSEELTPEALANAAEILIKINGLLEELGLTNVKVSSGFRPSTINSKLLNAAKKSLHMVCKACDIEDLDGSIGKLITEKPELLKKYSLWLEDIGSTKNWTHLDDSDTRKDRPIRIFKP